MLVNNTITVAQIRGFNPCYDPTDIEGVNEGGVFTVGEILDTPLIPAEDKIWLLTRIGVLPKPLLGEFARWCAPQVIDLWGYTETVRRFLETGDDSIRAAARNAAWNAAGAASLSMAETRNATRNSEWNAANATAWAATWNREEDAAWSAACLAIEGATRAAQLAELKDIVNKWNDKER